MIESVGSSTRIEGSKLTDADVENLLSGLQAEPFASRDEQEVLTTYPCWFDREFIGRLCGFVAASPSLR